MTRSFLFNSQLIHVEYPLRYDFRDYPGEVNLLPSMTVPDQSMSIKDMMARFVRGLPVTGVKVPEYADIEDEDDPDYIPDPKFMDPVDRADYAAEAKLFIDKTVTDAKKRKEPPADPAQSAGS